MKRLKKYIVLILSIVTAIFAFPLTACGEDYDKDVVGVDGFTREEVIEIRHAYVKNYCKNKKSKLQYVNIKSNFGIYNGNMVAVIWNADPDISYPAQVFPAIFVNGTYVATVLDYSYSVVVVSNGECMHIISAYEAGMITDEHLSQIIEVSKAKGYYDEDVLTPPPWLQE